MGEPRPDVLAILRAPLEAYPPSLNQVRLLARRGVRVAVAELSPSLPTNDALAGEIGVQRHRLGQARVLEKPAPIARRLADHVRFSRGVRDLLKRLRPAVVLAYDPNAMLASGRREAGGDAPYTIWHFHELFDPAAAALGPLGRRAIRFADAHAREADCVVFPDAHRASAYQERIGHALDVEIVMNCPLRVADDALPADALRPRLASLGLDQHAPIVLFQGWIGRSRAIAEVIASMAHWPDDARLVLIGPVREGAQRALEADARTHGVARRVHFLGPVPYTELMSYTVGADVGLSLVSSRADGDPNWRYTAGALNKRFEYMAAGVPQIASVGPGMAEVIEHPGVGVLVDPDDPEAIGAAIADLLSDRERRIAMGRRAREAHLTRFAYEHQMAPLMRRIEVALAARSDRARR